MEEKKGEELGRKSKKENEKKNNIGKSKRMCKIGRKKGKIGLRMRVYVLVHRTHEWDGMLRGGGQERGEGGGLVGGVGHLIKKKGNYVLRKEGREEGEDRLGK